MDGPRSRKKSWFRRLLRVGLFLLAVGGLTVAALPTLLSTAPARAFVVGRINKAVAPSRVGLAGMSLSWTGSVRLTGLTLKDGDGKTLITAKQAVLNRGLLALARDQNRLGVLTIDGAVVDVERRADGSIDLVDALMPPKPHAEAAGPVAPKPEAASGSNPIDLTVRLVRSSITIRSPELPQPFAAESAEAEVRMPATAEKLTARVRLAKPPGAPEGSTLGLDAEYDHHAPADPDLSLTLHAQRWPLAVDTAGVAAKGDLDGLLKVERAGGLWVTHGDARLLKIDAAGPALAGDRLAFDAAAGVWDVSQSATGWQVEKLDLACPVASLTGSGGVPTDLKAAFPQAMLKGQIDLAALAKQIPHTLHIRDGLTLERGSAAVSVVLATQGQAQRATVEAKVSDLAARDAERAFTLRDPATVNLVGVREGEAVRLETFAAKTAFLDLKGAGDLDKGVRVDGKIDLDQVVAQLKDLIDFGGVQLAGKGAIVADYRKKAPGYVGRFAAELRGLKVAGLTAEPIDRDAVRLDAAASGPADASGVPQGWEDARINLTSPKDKVSVAAQSKGNLLGLGASVETPAKVGERDAQASARLMLHWQRGEGGRQGVVSLDELRLGLKPTDSAGPPIALAVKGRVDLDAEDATLFPLPLPAGSVAPLAVAPTGMSIHGFVKTPASKRLVNAVVVGDVAAIDQALAAWNGTPPHGLAGKLDGHATVAPDKSGRLALNLAVQIPDLSRPGPDGKGREVEGLVALGFQGTYDPQADAVTCEQMGVATRYAALGAKGTLAEATGRRVADLSGTLTPNWATLTHLAGQMVEPKTRLAGGPRDFYVKGPLSGPSLASMLKGLDAELGLDLQSADAFGLALGRAPIVLRCRGGALTLDPIQTTLNNGRVDLRPIPVVDDAQGILLQLAKGSNLQGIELNDEVSQRVLGYVAPVLNDATQVTGKVSMTVDQAEIPISCPPNKTLTMTGMLVFQDVVCSPGPFSNQVLSLVGKSDEPGLRIKQPVQLAVANRRVIQKGLQIPIRKDAKVALEGSVGFDQTLDLKAVVPVTAGMVGSRSDLGKLVGGDTKVTVPIGGTVKSPRINKEALQVALRELTRGALKREVSQQGAKLLKDLGVPADAAPADPAEGGRPAGGIPTDAKSLEKELLRRLVPGRRGP